MAYSKMAVRIFNSPGSLAKSLAGAGTTTTTSSSDTANGMSASDSHGDLSDEKPRGVTFAAQDKLPKLPIPELNETCRKYLEALKPLQSIREHEETKGAVAEFLKNAGPELQERLKKYATDKSSYIEQFWYDSYLNYDNPVVLNLNPFFLLEDDPTPARNDQVTRAASLVISALSFVRAVRREELSPDTARGTPLCMYQYSRLFGTARVPTENGCMIGQDSDSKHMVVMCRGQFYWFDVLDERNDIIMTEKDVAVNLQVIVEDAEQTPIQEAAKGALGVLSTENRKIWSGLRDVLTREPGSNNAECLSMIDTALFVLCLDYTEPTNTAELCANMLCGTNEVVKGVQIGTCTNRWYDKLQIIVCKNGSAGINFEHTGVDGHTVLRFASDVYTDTILRFARTINGQAPSLWASQSPDPSKRDPDSFGMVSTIPHKLEWDMTPELAVSVRFAETRLADLIQQNEFETLDFTGYGKNFITSMGLSPDAFVQMAFQAAYYGLYGRVENSYEPAMTKFFLHGRTEAIRSVTAESADFVKTFWADNPPKAKVDALKKAAAKHTAITKDCAKAQGQDRHLYALYCVWQRAVDAEGVEAEAEYGSTGSEYETDVGSMSGVGSGMSSPVPGGQTAVLPADELAKTNGGGSNTSATTNIITTADQETKSPPNGAARSPSPISSSSLTPAPPIFTDSGWDRINNTIISTSNCGNPSLRHFGFGPTSADGFGLGYIIKEDSISICASSKHRQTRRFIEGIEGYLNEIRRVLRAVQVRSGSTGAGFKTSRAREVDEGVRKEGISMSGNGTSDKRPGANTRASTTSQTARRGRLIAGKSGTATPMTDSADVEDDEMGGCMFLSFLCQT